MWLFLAMLEKNILSKNWYPSKFVFQPNLLLHQSLFELISFESLLCAIRLSICACLIYLCSFTENVSQGHLQVSQNRAIVYHILNAIQKCKIVFEHSTFFLISDSGNLCFPSCQSTFVLSTSRTRLPTNLIQVDSLGKVLKEIGMVSAQYKFTLSV